MPPLGDRGGGPTISLFYALAGIMFAAPRGRSSLGAPFLWCAYCFKGPFNDRSAPSGWLVGLRVYPPLREQRWPEETTPYSATAE